MVSRTKARGFLILHSFQDQVEMLTDEEAGKLFKMIFRFEIDGTEPTNPDRVINIVFQAIKQFLLENRAKYEDTCKKNQENISRRWEKSIRPNTTVYDRIRTDTNHTKLKSNSKFKSNSKQKLKNKKYISEYRPSPTIDDVMAYAQERGRIDLAGWFFEHYENADPPWTDIGGNPVRSWKQKFNTWERRTPPPPTPKVKEYLT